VSAGTLPEFGGLTESDEARIMGAVTANTPRTVATAGTDPATAREPQPSTSRPRPATHGAAGWRAGCRCAKCVKGIKNRARQQRRKARGLHPLDPIHGEYAGYVAHGCRCDPCHGAFLAYERARRVAL